MNNKRPHLFSLFLIMALLSSVILLDAFGADPANRTPKDMPKGMGAPPGFPPGGPPGGFSVNAPGKAAIYIENGTANSSNEYAAGKYSENIQSGANGVTIQNLELFSGDYIFNGIVAVGAKTNVTLDKCKIRLGVDKAASAKDKGGSAAAVDEGATMHINNSDLQVDGAGRYVTSNYNDGTLIINDSSVTSTGSNANTSEITEPFSNAPLLISGTARTNFSVGASKTYYFNSTCTAEGWGALSTDAARPEGLDLYAYNSKSIAQNGGYGTYADFDCRVWLYGSHLNSPEVGAIISKSGLITVADGRAAPEAVTRYNLGKTTTAGTTITAGRNAVMIHAPDMFGKGKAAADCGTLNVINSTLATTRDLKSTRNYAATYGKAIGAYVDYISGAAILVKSTSANINLEDAKIDSYSGIIAMTVLNSDTMGNFLADGDAGSGDVKPIAISMKDMDAQGDIRHMDYQRIMTLSLDNVTLKGMVVSGTMKEWNSLWTAYDKADCNWLKNESWNSCYGVRMTVKKGSTWNVSGRSTLSSLTIENGGMVNGDIQVDGKPITPSAGKTYTGKIVVTPSLKLKAIKLNEPNLKRGLPFMETLSVKASARQWSDRDLSLQDLSDLLWAANGINRPEERKYTASSAQNAHDVDLYLFMKNGVYLYNYHSHVLEPVMPGDFRSRIMMRPPPRPKKIGDKSPPPRPVPSNPPIQIILISDSSRFKMGPPELRYEWGAIDTGIVSQNISLFCAATGIKTRPRASMDKEKIKKLLQLDDRQYVFLNHPAGYSK